MPWTDTDINVYKLFIQKTTVAEAKDQHALAQSQGKLCLIYKTILGDHAELVKDIDAKEAFDTLCKELSRAVMTFEWMQLMNELLALRYNLSKEDFPAQ